MTVGGAFGGIDIYTQDPGNRTFGSVKEYFGWTAGAGLEYALTRNFTVRAEYSYYDFGAHNATVDRGYRVRHDVHSHTAKVGVTYRF